MSHTNLISKACLLLLFSIGRYGLLEAAKPYIADDVNAGAKPKDSLPCIYRWGYPPQYLFQMCKLAPRYGFKLISVGGCYVKDSVGTAANANNDTVRCKLDETNGPGWHQKWLEESIALHQLEEEIGLAVYKMTFAKELNARMREEGNGLHCRIWNEPVNNIYEVSVEGYDVKTPDSHWMHFYSVFVKVVKPGYVTFDEYEGEQYTAAVVEIIRIENNKYQLW